MNLTPKKLFLIDAIGAFISFVMLGFILPNFQEYIGMPGNILTYLSYLAFSLMIFSGSCFLFVKRNQRFFLTAIGILNTFYVLISLVFMYFYFHELSLLGFMYFVIEKGIVLTLVTLELKTSFK